MIRVNVTGCSLVDNLYSHIDFNSPAYTNLLSKEIGDGGLKTGGLTFSEALAAFADKDYSELLSELTGATMPDNSNIGGPGIVPVLHASQVCSRDDIRYRFAGIYGQDANGRRLQDLLSRCAFPMDDYTESAHRTPGTDVLSDPRFDGGRGERTFINTIGAAAYYGPESLPADFFDADLLLFGATALVPPLHDALDNLCRRGHGAGAFVMVSTVFDFRNESKMKGRPWPLVNDYSNIHLLSVDREESLKISGCSHPEEAMQFFLDAGCGSVIITQGADDILIGVSAKELFRVPARKSMPICHYADRIVKTLTGTHDTTGCGDNFVGGLLDSIAEQMAKKVQKINLEEAIIRAVAAGSLALTYLGGVYYEDFPDQKKAAMEDYLKAYRRELEGKK